MPPRLTGLALSGAAASWTALGFAPAGGAVQVGAIRIGFGVAKAGWTWDEASGEDLDGVPTGAEPPPPGPPPAHPNGALGLDHVVVATPDFERTRARFEAAEMDLRRIREAGPARQGFFAAGPALVELVGPREPDGTGPAGLWGVVVVVPDLDALARRLGDRLGSIRDAVQPGRRIATARGEAGLGAALAFMTPRAG